MAVPLAIIRWQGGKGQKVTATSVTTTATNAVGSATYALMMSCTTQNVRVEIGQSPAATTTSMLVKATDPPLVIGCAPGDKVAVIQDTAVGGILSFIELTY